ncbi:MAG: ABC transporter ATP-binding protein, partial [Bacilli bacterium]|nr:ABC transporter ATP-binding protein [Bacilli bacterium]
MNNFEEHDYSKDKFNFKIWKKILKLVLKRKKNVVFLLIFVTGLAFLDILYPLMNAYAIDNYFSENPDFSDVTQYILGYVAIAFGYLIVVWGFIRTAGIVEVEVGYELRNEAFRKLQVLPFSYYDRTPAGWIMARLTSDSRRLAGIISWGLVDMIWGLFTMTGILIVMYIINWRLALIVTFLLPILTVVSILFQKKILNSYRKVRKINSKITASFNEGIMGNKTTKTLVIEDAKSQDFRDLCFDMKRNSLRAIFFSSLFFPTVLVLCFIGVAKVLRVGGGFIVDVKFGFNIALLYLFVSYTSQFFDPVMQIAQILAELQQAQASAERILALIETDPDIKDTEEVVEKYGTLLSPKKENWEELKGDIEFQNVHFKYQTGETVLDNFNLKVKKGTSVALVGETGSGKSTIVNLICRFYEPVSGKILIDGRDYKDRSLGWLHSNLGYVLQTPHLFNGSIFENIRYGRLSATDEEVMAAAKAVYIDEFVHELPEGYQTQVGEGGAKLSVGQRQLISFARALIADPKILILDEATSSIDTKTEKAV